MDNPKAAVHPFLLLALPGKLPTRETRMHVADLGRRLTIAGLSDQRGGPAPREEYEIKVLRDDLEEAYLIEVPAGRSIWLSAWPISWAPLRSADAKQYPNRRQGVRCTPDAP